ncbi:hypothetical protein HZC21_00385, partial [Candidatus Peregrinibacteria bacterium]|nr:hypothetical protein [Candidatus Peregrinibacteria bacterium]
SYLRHKKTQEFISEYRRKNQVIDLYGVDLGHDSVDWTRAKNFLSQPSMFVESKVLIVKDGGSVDEPEWVSALNAEIKTTKTFVIISDEKKKKKKFSFLLKDPVKSQLFDYPDGRLLESFIKKESFIRNLVFAPEAERFFFEYVQSLENRSWMLINELDKISLANFSQPITLLDLRSLVQWLPRSEVFGLAREFLGTSQVSKKLCLLEQALVQGDAPAYIFNSMAYQARSNDINLLADYDISIKSGSLEYEEALTDFAIGK